MLHTSTLLRRLAWRDTSVLLSRTPLPWFVLQDRLCSVHAAGALPRDWRRLCAVKVKLTMTLALEGGPNFAWCHFLPRRVPETATLRAFAALAPQRQAAYWGAIA